MPAGQLKKIADEIDAVVKENEDVTRERDRLKVEVDIERVARAKAEIRADKMQRALERVGTELKEAVAAEDLIAEDILPSEPTEEELAYRRAQEEWDAEAEDETAHGNGMHTDTCGCADVKKGEETVITMSAIQPTPDEEPKELRSIRRAIFLDNARQFFVGGAAAVLRTLALATGVPAVLYVFFDQLARHGTYIEPLRSWWQPWVPTAFIILAILAVTFTVAYLIYFLWRHIRSIVMSVFGAYKALSPHTVNDIPIAKNDYEGHAVPANIPYAATEIVEPAKEIRETRLARLKSVLPRKKEKEQPEELDAEALGRLVRLFQSTDDDKPKLGEK